MFFKNAEKHAIIFTFTLLYVCVFLPGRLKDFFLFLLFSCLIMICMSVCVSGFLSLGFSGLLGRVEFFLF